MSSVTVNPASGPLHGCLRMPGDKSIAHRAVLFNAAAQGRALIRGLPSGQDVASTVAAMRALGVAIEETPAGLVIEGCARRFRQPKQSIDCGNSGTTARLLMGLLAGSDIQVTLDGDASLRRRPMARVAEPLAAMGAEILTSEGCLPATVTGSLLRGASQRLSVASAQLKTALLLAGLSAEGSTAVQEPVLSRDHSERMLAAMGIPMVRAGNTVSVQGPATANCVDVDVCGDSSSAAFFVVGALIVPGSEITIEGVCLNPTRTGFLDILRRMGADIDTRVTGCTAGEDVGVICAKASALQGTTIEEEMIPSAVDELPVLAVAAACAKGRTVIRGADELRHKESDRIRSVATMLAALEISVDEKPDGMEILGGSLCGGIAVDSQDDHRLAMSAAVAALAADAPVQITGAEAASVSFPNFFRVLEGCSA